jgi:hypothetical protein
MRTILLGSQLGVVGSLSVVVGQRRGGEVIVIDEEVLACWRCRHDVDEHDERGRCGLASCPCGWSGDVRPAGDD